MEALKLSLLICLVAFGAHAQFSAQQYLAGHNREFGQFRVSCAEPIPIAFSEITTLTLHGPGLDVSVRMEAASIPLVLTSDQLQ